MSLYQYFIRPLLFSLNAEEAHDLMMGILGNASHYPRLIRLIAGKRVPDHPRIISGINFPNLVGLAAGMDKNGIALSAWEALGFGFIEIGTITSRPQIGNLKPRIFRFPDHQGMINRLGFNNEGVEKVAARMELLHEQGRWPRIPVGMNIGKSKVTSLETAHMDYLASFQRLYGLGDYVVINVSSPNTPGLRDLQCTTALKRIIGTLRDWEGTPRIPLFVKVSPDLAEEDLIGIVHLIEAEQLSGLIATNTTIDHSEIPTDRDQIGGLSGLPLASRSLATLHKIRRHTKIPVIACGGISDAKSAKERLDAGADLLQVYTSFIYQGPALLRRLATAFETLNFPSEREAST